MYLYINISLSINSDQYLFSNQYVFNFATTHSNTMCLWKADGAKTRVKFVLVNMYRQSMLTPRFLTCFFCICRHAHSGSFRASVFTTFLQQPTCKDEFYRVQTTNLNVFLNTHILVILECVILFLKQIYLHINPFLSYCSIALLISTVLE